MIKSAVKPNEEARTEKCGSFSSRVGNKKIKLLLYKTLFILPVPEERYLCRM